MIRATLQDRPAIEAFLKAHIATSMFPLANLRRYGMSGGHSRAMQFWVRWEAGEIVDLLPLSDEGALFPQCPNRVWGDVKTILTGKAVKGMLGDAEQIAELRNVLGLPAHGGLDVEEPLYELPLKDMLVPDCTGFTLRPLTDAPRDLIIAWRCAYLKEALPMPGEDPKQKAKDDVDSFIAADTHRVLYEGDTPMAMTGFNATLPEAVQIGAVYTPPADRSRGLARRAVAMHLQEAQADGVERAILFAASPQACKAYEAIGFRRTGDYTILFYQEPQVIYG
ncbi:acetyltransferase (GNAT) family protein [Yoonia maricola]|uniref:Acetyltransferase (GNAT) family protein n=1 Tax=Yoonia maricola TaxID=420999 RepID=A0A2M8WQ35_9RHOB|nr:GNAT family N-acetyltransferase [Yoonia maricola]PJI93037.1 acetyltransferase (GNAT) family protein [Yoonia maricola]